MDGQEPIMVFGRVTRGDGGPLAGAALTLCDLAGDQLDRTVADDGGYYQLVPPTGGTYLVICSSPTHRPKASLVAVSDRPLRHELVLAGGGATLVGTVGARRRSSMNGATNGSGDDAPRRSAPYGDVVLTLTDVRGAVVAVSRSDASGGYRFTDLAEGTYTLTAAAPHLGPVAETVAVPADGEVVHDVSLISHTQLTGVVRSAGGGRPVAEALATLVGEDGNVVGSAVTADDGTFRFTDVAQGLYTLTASGYAPVASEIEVGPGRPSDVVLTLVPPTVDGRPAHAGPDREPLRGASGAPKHQSRDGDAPGPTADDVERADGSR